jgi:hypothetical protein
MKPCRKCGSTKIEYGYGQTLDGWMAWLTCEACNHAVWTVSGLKFEKAAECAERIWERDAS